MVRVLHSLSKEGSEEAPHVNWGEEENTEQTEDVSVQAGVLGASSLASLSGWGVYMHLLYR